jgi:DnaJ-domain-containing protein 1
MFGFEMRRSWLEALAVSYASVRFPQRSICDTLHTSKAVSEPLVRVDTYFAGACLVQELATAGSIAHVHHDGGDIIHVELTTREHVLIHLIESSIPLHEVMLTLKSNSAESTHTLFLFWADRLLPLHNQVYEVDDWMMPLLELYNNVLYGYEVAGRKLLVFPVNFQGYGKTRTIRYGDPIDVRELHCNWREYRSAHLHGIFYAADFAKQEGNQKAPEHATHTLERFYQALGLPVDSDSRTVKRAYRKLARQYHPDLNTTTEAHAKMQHINEAYARIIRHLKATH